MIFGGAISWMTKYQAIDALSTMEAEYMAATRASKKAICLKRLISDIGFDARHITIYCDNQSVIYLEKNATFHARRKHIVVQYHFFHDMVEDRKVKLEKVATLENVMDALTKPVNTKKLRCCVSSMGLGSCTMIQ